MGLFWTSNAVDLLVDNDIRVLFGLVDFGAVARSWIMKKK
jgi:hypothetical protein